MATNNSENNTLYKAKIISSATVNQATVSSDVWYQLSIGTSRSYAIGVDFSDSNRLKITHAASGTIDPSSGSTVLTADPATGNIWLSGISFNSGANVLSTFSEGTFTPTLTGATTAGSGVYFFQFGYYQRIGNICHIVYNSSTQSNTGTGIVNIGGLPFTVRNDGLGVGQIVAGAYRNVGIFYVSNIQAQIASTVYRAYAYGAGISTQDNITNNGGYQFSASYFI
jgi:hypothetical protein